jgi:hypothetical protein
MCLSVRPLLLSFPPVALDPPDLLVQVIGTVQRVADLPRDARLSGLLAVLGLLTHWPCDYDLWA